MNPDFITAILLLGVVIGLAGTLITKSVNHFKRTIESRKEPVKKSYLEIVNDGYDDWVEKSGASLDGFSIAGINYRYPNDSWIGKFSGVLKAEPWNEHDKDAIAIFRLEKVGYIPKDETHLLHERLKENGGVLLCDGYIHAFVNELNLKRYAGKVIVEEKP